MELRQQEKPPKATDQWTVKEVLAHITFWHINYAANYQALANKLPPPLLKGPGCKINSDGVAALREYSRGN